MPLRNYSPEMTYAVVIDADTGFAPNRWNYNIGPKGANEILTRGGWVTDKEVDYTHPIRVKFDPDKKPNTSPVQLHEKPLLNPNVMTAIQYAEDALDAGLLVGKLPSPVSTSPPPDKISHQESPNEAASLVRAFVAHENTLNKGTRLGEMKTIEHFLRKSFHPHRIGEWIADHIYPHHETPEANSNPTAEI